MINLGFWGQLKRPIICLAPMADVTDVAFRHIIAKTTRKVSSLSTDIFLLKNSSSSLQSSSLGTLGNFSGNYVTYTEFVSADGLVRAPEAGKKKLLKDLEYSEIERPIVAQFFSGKPEMLERAARLAVELGFDGVDINMGCPDKSIEKQGAGAGLIKNPNLAKEIILAAMAGAGKLPVSVKTRLGYNQDELETWLPTLLSVEPACITIHARTRKEMSKVPARWERVKRAVEIRNEVQGDSEIKTLILGNGDVRDVEDGLLKIKETGADGVMLGRAIFGNPFLFATSTPTPRERLEVLREHIRLFDEKLGGVKNFAIMKKHFKSYLSFIPNSHDLKEVLMLAPTSEVAVEAIDNFLLYNLK